MVSEFCTHRTDVEVLWMDESVAQWDDIIKNSFHKYYPICKDSVDDIVGILNIHSYFRLNDKKKENILEKCVESAYFVPETLKADALFKQMKKEKKMIAVVLDEHGGVEGIVTMDDILEQIVGDFNCENENKTSIKKVGDNIWEICGSISIEEINENLNLKLSDEEYDTFSGFVLGQYGTIPPDNTKFEIIIEDLYISVEEIAEHRIEKAIIKRVCKE
jgi:putative hemolysin